MKKLTVGELIKLLENVDYRELLRYELKNFLKQYGFYREY